MKYNNLNNFDDTELTNVYNMIYNTPENIVICINEKITKNNYYLK